MGLRWRGSVLVTAVGAAVLLAGCTGGSDNDSSSGSSIVQGDGAVTIVGKDQRGEPVRITGTALSGETLDLAAFRGRPVVVNVWGSWCGPCRKEAPALQAAYTQLKPSGVVFLGIDTRDDDPAQAKAFEESFGITYPSIVDSGGGVLLNLRGVVAPNSVPTTLVIDEQGRVAARVSGPVDTKTLVGLVGDTRLNPTATPVDGAAATPSATASGTASPSPTASAG